jgi:hypothetical protein
MSAISQRDFVSGLGGTRLHACAAVCWRAAAREAPRQHFRRGAQPSEARVILRHRPDCGMF